MKESIKLFEGVTRLQGVCRERHSADGRILWLRKENGITIS